MSQTLIAPRVILRLADLICVADGVSSVPYIGWQLSLHRMAAPHTQLGNSPYIGWQSRFCNILNIQDFSGAFFAYKFFYRFLYESFYKGSHTPEWWKQFFMKTTLHYPMNSLIHELNNS